jgi:peptidoglycan hydrolase CwlO-like protein
VIEIVVALITCGGTILGVWMQNRKHNRDISELIEYRVSKLEEKQDKHNNMIERVYQLEGAVELLDNKIKSSNYRIKDLEEDAKDGR